MSFALEVSSGLESSTLVAFLRFIAEVYGFSGLVGFCAILAISYICHANIKIQQRNAEEWPKVATQLAQTMTALRDEIAQVRHQQTTSLNELIRVLEKRGGT